MSDYEPKQGERVRVVLEGEAHSLSVSRRDGSFGIGANYINPENNHVVSVEKVEPPVVTFKPGDVVRHRHHPEWLYAVTGDGYVALTGGGGLYVPLGEPQIDSEPFASDRYELVELK